MAVYTSVPAPEVDALFVRLGLGVPTGIEPVRGGIENTNFFVQTAGGRWVLTLFERLRADELPFYLHFMKHLARCGLPVPDPRADAGGEILHHLAGKPAAVVNRLPGRHHLAPDVEHCAQVGDMLARLHEAGARYERQQANPRGLDWCQRTAADLRVHLDAPRRDLLDGELAFLGQAAASPAWSSLPRGPIHADLFRDNVMFEPVTPDGVDALPVAATADRLCGLVDFYFAGVEALAFDLAVCLNDWCIDLESGRLDDTRARALVAAYQRRRPLTGVEQRLMPALLRAAALRFWLSRLADLQWPRTASVLQPHDPAHFERVLRQRIAEPWHPEPV
jgi:homoserine kinase type II